jgi:epoxide hydrolase 4
MSDSFRHEFVSANGIRFHVVTAGEGPLVVLLHGFPQFWYAWRHQIPALATRFRVAVPDLRGYGQTDKPPRVADYAIATLSRDIAELVNALGEKKAHVVAHDWGGGVAWDLVGRYPEVVDRLAVLNCPHPVLFGKALRSNFRQLRRSWYMFFFQIPWLPEAIVRLSPRRASENFFRGMAIRKDTFTDEDLDRFAEAMAIPGAMTGALNYYRAMFRNVGELRRQEANLAKIASPTLLIWAENDIALGKELTLGMESLFTSSFRIHYVPNCSHWVNEEQPELVNRLLLEHFAGAGA